MIKSVTIGGQDMLTAHGLHLVSKSIGFPEVQTKLVEIPARNGALDLTEALTGAVKYGNREVSMSFYYRGADADSKASEVANLLHGRKFEIAFDDDPAFYYVGRLTVSTTLHQKRTVLSATVSADCEPYKYDILGSDEDWLWDPFDFESGIVNETHDVKSPGKISLYARIAGQTPTFTASAPLTMSFGGESYSLAAGENKFYDIFLAEGENVFTFTGSGAVTLHYRGGSL